MQTMREILNNMSNDSITLDIINGEITDKDTVHCFVEEFYEKEFLKYKNSKITLIEVGVQFGRSLLLWDKYFPDATIFGVDSVKAISPDLETYFSSTQKINYIVADGYSEEISNSLPEFDIFIDDGPHNIESQLKSIDLYLKKMKLGGIFVIEDVAFSEYISVMMNHVSVNYPGYVCYGIDLRPIKGRFDDLMFVIKHKGDL